MPRLQIDCTDKLHATLKGISAQTGLTITCICRMAIDRAIRQGIDPKEAALYAITPGRK